MSKKLVALSVIALLGAAALPYAANADDPGVFKIPGTDTTLKFNGFAEAALFYEFSGGYNSLAKACDYYLCAPGIALSGTPNINTPQMAMTAAYSRFGVQSSTPSKYGAIGMRFEVDAAKGYQLIGQTDTHSSYIRIRHAYGTVGDTLLIGQSWSTFADLNVFPDQMDENPLANLAAIRAPQIRVTFPAGPTKISLALEDPYATGFASTHYNIPDVIARLDIPASIGSFSIRGVTKQFANDVRSKQGFGGAVGAALNFAGDSLVLDGSVGSGIGAYQYGTALGPTAEDGVATANDILLWTTFGISAGFTHVWNSLFRSNLMGSALIASDNSDIQTAQGAAAYGANNKDVYTFGFNTYWNVTKTFWTGAEFYYNYRKDFGGNHGDEFRGELVSHFNLF